MSLQAQFAEAVKAAQVAIEANDVVEAKAQRVKAETIKAQIEEWNAIATLGEQTEKMAPKRPALPGTGSTGSEIVSGEKTASEGDPTIIKAAYVNRVGKGDDEIVQILTELHGEKYASKFWTQKAVFNRYLRHGEVALTNGEDRTLLKSVIMTPGAIKTALDQGVDSVALFKTTMVEAADSLGGYVVPIDTQSRIIARLKGYTIVRPKATPMSTSRDRIEMPRMRDNGSDTTDRYTSPVRVRWVDETPSALEAQNLTFGMQAISVHTSMVEAFLSRNLLEDAAFQLEDYLEEKLAEAAAFDEDDQFLFGDGIGKPKGILPGRTNELGLTEVTSGSTTTPFFTWEKLMSVPYQIARQYRTPGASWVMNRRAVLAIHQLKNSIGEFYWRNYNETGGDAGPQERLLGYNVEENESFPDVATNAYPILFGDLKAYTIVDRVGMTVERYVDSYTARQNLVVFVMRRRLGGSLLEPWRLATVRVAA